MSRQQRSPSAWHHGCARETLVCYDVGAGTGLGYLTMAAATVTVLFTDLVGSTALLARLGEERAEELRREHFGLLRQALGKTAGLEVKNLGDGLMVVFPSAADGVAGAVAIQQLFERRNRDASEQLLVRVGVAAGDADIEDGDYFGLPVIEAARLCARAEGQEILVTDLARALAGSRRAFEFASVGPLELKGLDQPVVTWRVTWEPHGVADDLAIELPSRVETASLITFVGRAREREALDASLKAAEGGERRVVLISGEPGIGKTALSSAFAHEAFGRGAVVLYGRCDEDLGIPYQPWSEALSHLVRHAPGDLLEAHVAARGGELMALAPDLATRTAVGLGVSSDGESERYLLFGAVVDLLARASALAPVVLVLDDLHWADRPTLQLLRHIVSADTSLCVLAIGTFRESDISSEHPLSETLAALHREAGVERLPLRGLGDDELLALLETAAGHEMTEDGVALRDTLLAETEGNPFFVGEMLRHLAETRAIFQDEHGRWIASPDLRTAGLPISIREVIGRRVARLGAQTQAVLSIAAVIGRDFDVDVLSRVVDVDDDTVIELCDRAVATAVLTESDVPGRYTFAHALIEHTLYDGLSASRRALAHRQVAETLEAMCGNDPAERIGELAYHWAHATQLQDTDKAIMYAQGAGDRALAQLAPDEAVRWYRDAVDLLDRASAENLGRRAELLLGLGDAQRQTGDPAHRETLLAAARLADDVGAIETLVRAALRNNRGWNSIIGAVDDERVEVLTRALDRLGEVDTADRARLLALLCLERFYDADFDERLSMATRAVEIARRIGDKAALVDAIRLSHESITMPQTLELRLQWNGEAAALAEELGDPIARLWSNNYRFLAAAEAGDLATLRAAFAIFESESERIGQPLNRWHVAFHRAWQRMLDGDLDTAEEIATDALTLGTAAGHADAVTIYGAQIIALRWMQGRLVELVPLIEQAMNDNPGLQVFRSALAWAHCFDSPGETTRMLDDELVTGFPMYPDSNWLMATVNWAEAATRCGHQAGAILLRERLLPWHAQISSSHASVHGGVAHYLGRLEHLLGRHDQADEWFAEALTRHERLEAPYLVAWTQTAWAELLADRDLHGDAEKARLLLKDAVPVATAHGYAYVARDGRAVLERLA